MLLFLTTVLGRTHLSYSCAVPCNGVSPLVILCTPEYDMLDPRYKLLPFSANISTSINRTTRSDSSLYLKLHEYLCKAMSTKTTVTPATEPCLTPLYQRRASQYNPSTLTTVKTPDLIIPADIKADPVQYCFSAEQDFPTMTKPARKHYHFMQLILLPACTAHYQYLLFIH